MSVIIKDMDMPIDCLGCRIILCDRESYLKSGRPKDCPLNEVVRCKDCKHFTHYADGCGVCTERDNILTYQNQNDFCSYGERKGGGSE